MLEAGTGQGAAPPTRWPGLPRPHPHLLGTDKVSGPAPSGRHKILTLRAQILFHKLWIRSH